MSHEEALREAAAVYRQRRTAYKAARKDLIAVIKQAAGDEMRQVDILQATGHVWTREQVRRICLPASTTTGEPVVAESARLRNR